MILASHGYGEELILYATAGGGGVASAGLLLWRVRVSRMFQWLRRR